MSCMDSEAHFGYCLLKERKKHSLISFPPMAPLLLPTSPLSTPLLSALCWVCILRVQSTVFLSLGSVSMSLHLICIRFSTLSGSYLIPTQYAAEGNWVLRPGERGREVFGGFLNSLQYSVVVSMELAWQHEATEVCVIAIEREGNALQTMLPLQYRSCSSPHFNTTYLLVETARE